MTAEASTASSPNANTRTPETAESPASRPIDPITTSLRWMPARRSQRIRASGVQTAPGTYFASIEAISDWSASG